MRLLLDTHAFLWFIIGDPRLSVTARTAIEDPNNETVLSVASAWEIAIKVGIGKLFLAEPFQVIMPREIQRNGITVMGIELSHLAAVVALPYHHRDPFDRLLVAQANSEHMPIVSADPVFDAYAAGRIW